MPYRPYVENDQRLEILIIRNQFRLSGIVHIGTLEILDGKSYPAFWVNLSNSPLKVDPIDELVTEVEFSPWFYCNFLNFFRYIYLIMSVVYVRRRSTWFDPLHQSHGSSKFVWMCHRIWAILTPRYPMWISTKVARLIVTWVLGSTVICCKYLSADTCKH